MNWISVKDRLPEYGKLVLINRIVDMGGYDQGLYIAHLAFVGRQIFIIDDFSTNQNNYRPIEEFSHWMPLPEEPNNESCL